MNALRQLALPFRHSPHYAAEDVLAAPFNAQALAWLDRRETQLALTNSFSSIRYVIESVNKFVS